MPEVTVVKQPKQERPELSRWLGYFQQAIEADPTYAPAYSGLADSYSMSRLIRAQRLHCERCG